MIHHSSIPTEMFEEPDGSVRVRVYIPLTEEEQCDFLKNEVQQEELFEHEKALIQKEREEFDKQMSQDMEALKQKEKEYKRKIEQVKKETKNVIKQTKSVKKQLSKLHTWILCLAIVAIMFIV
jgi:septal ring factor EnvC (AmiA/AmiB activator)